MEEKKYGVIHEIGDLGLGFDHVNEEDNHSINEQTKEKKDDEKK